MTGNPDGCGGLPALHAAHYVTRPVEPDGRAASPLRAAARRTPRFVDMATGTPAPMATAPAVLWDETNLYIAFWAQEPNLTARMTGRDALLFFENDLEIFIDGGNSCCELEFYALGTVCEVFYIWRDAFTKGSHRDQPRLTCITRASTALAAITNATAIISGPAPIRAARAGLRAVCVLSDAKTSEIARFLGRILIQDNRKPL